MITSLLKLQVKEVYPHNVNVLYKMGEKINNLKKEVERKGM